MKKAGKVLRDPLADPGLVSVGGQYYPFVLEMWQSEVPPKPGLPVDVEFDPEGKICAIKAIPECELDKAQAESGLAAARAQGTTWTSKPASKFGLASLVAAGLLVVSWLLLADVR
jgi:hypothetical protein